jgi:putative ABC transport system ATP-binding protein
MPCGCAASAAERGSVPVLSSEVTAAMTTAAMSTADSMTDTSGEVIRAEGLTRSFAMGTTTVQALRGVDLVIRRGEYVAIMGPSGSGKSTLMNLIGCLDTPTTGQYWLNGQPVAQLEEHELARIRNKEIGFVFQTFNLLPRASALRNVELPLIYGAVPPAERKLRAAEALQQVDLADRMDHRPNQLSGGQRQRVSIARALVTRPALLLADEPTGNLDSKTSVEIMALFDRLHRAGNTIVVVTHERDIAEHANRIVTIRDGMIASDERFAGWGAVNIVESTRLAVESIWANRLRSFLTLLGVIIGIASIIATAAVIHGLNLYVAEKLSNLGKGVFTVQRFGLITNREQFLEAIRRNKRLLPADARAIADRCGLAEVVAWETHAQTDLKRGEHEILDTTSAASRRRSSRSSRTTSIKAACSTTKRTVRRRLRSSVHDVAERLFPGVDPIGKELRVRGLNLRSSAWRQRRAPSSASRRTTTSRSRTACTASCSAAAARSTSASRRPTMPACPRRWTRCAPCCARAITCDRATRRLPDGHRRGHQ